MKMLVNSDWSPEVEFSFNFDFFVWSFIGLIYYESYYVSHLLKLLNRKKILENSFLKNGILKFWSAALIISIITYPWNFLWFHDQNIACRKIVITNFRENLRKLSNTFFKRILMMKDVYENLKHQLILS